MDCHWCAVSTVVRLKIHQSAHTNTIQEPLQNGGVAIVFLRLCIRTILLISNKQKVSKNKSQVVVERAIRITILAAVSGRLQSAVKNATAQGRARDQHRLFWRERTAVRSARWYDWGALSCGCFVVFGWFLGTVNFVAADLIITGNLITP